MMAVELPPTRHNGGPPIDDAKVASGWIKIYRDIRRHPIVGFGQPMRPADPRYGAYSRAEAFQDLIMEAQYRPSRTKINGREAILHVGQLLGARSFLATRWNWSEQAVRTFLTHLTTAHMVTINQLDDRQGAASRKSAPNAITVCNYEKYQAYEDAITKYVDGIEKPANPPSEQPASNQLATSYPPASNQNLRPKEGKKEKEDTREVVEAQQPEPEPEPTPEPPPVSAAVSPPTHEPIVRKDSLGRPIEGPEADVEFDGKTITLVNGERSHWLAKFGGSSERLDLALTSAANFIQPNSNKSLLVQVRHQLARAAVEKIDKDQRYATAAASNKPSPKTNKFKLSRW